MGIVQAIGAFDFLVVTYELRCFPSQKALWLYYHIALTILNIMAVPLLNRLGLTSLRTAMWIFYAAGAGVVHYHRERLGGTRNDHLIVALLQTYVLAVSSLIVRNVKFPERFFPQSYDLWMPSHALFHIIVAVSPFPLLLAYYNAFLAGEFDVPCAD
jgi:predicted membrane channel-forming protein YqfA (hemolysin III family)